MASEPTPLPYPVELSAELRVVLGTMIFQSAPIARALRLAGEEIPRKSEDEQAFVLHWLIRIVLEHGAGWRPVALARMQELEQKTRERAAALSQAEG